MQFVPSFDFGAAVNGYRTAMKDWREQELFPLDMQLRQAQADNATAQAQAAQQTNAARISSTNAILGAQGAKAEQDRDLMLLGRPGAEALVRMTNTGRLANEAAWSPEQMRAMAELNRDHRLASGTVLAQDAVAAAARNPVLNETRDIVGTTARTTAQGQSERAPTEQRALMANATLSEALAAARLEDLPTLVQTQAMQIQNTYERANAALTDNADRVRLRDMNQQVQGMLGQYAEMRQTIANPVALGQFIQEHKALTGQDLTPEQARRVLDEQTRELSRSIQALSGGMQDLVRNNDTSIGDQVSAMMLAGRYRMPGTAAGATGATGDNSIAGGGLGAFRSPTGAPTAPAAAPAQTDVDKVLDRSTIKPEPPPAPKELTPVQKLVEKRKPLEARMELLSDMMAPSVPNQRRPSLSVEDRKRVSDEWIALSAEVAKVKAEEQLLKKAEAQQRVDAQRNLLGIK